ncbi:MAG: hypothetical protein NZ518_00545 [Dehalococcoidia bacterium]|nr:hypothetical protein [Dehalococcoidia bacterium]
MAELLLVLVVLAVVAAIVLTVGATVLAVLATPFLIAWSFIKATLDHWFGPHTVPGRLSEGMRRERRVAGRQRLERVLKRKLPAWPITPLLAEATGELIDLKQSARIAESLGVPAGVLAMIVDEAERAADGIWRIADRVSAVAAQKVAYRVVESSLQPEMANLRRLIVAARSARESLAHLTIAGYDHRELEAAERNLRALTDAARELQQLEQQKIDRGYRPVSAPSR